LANAMKGKVTLKGGFSYQEALSIHLLSYSPFRFVKNYYFSNEVYMCVCIVGVNQGLGLVLSRGGTRPNLLRSSCDHLSVINTKK
jgi:hypothetical protein